MKQYQVDQVCRLNEGLVELNEDQARRRSQNIKHVEDNVYRILKPVQFKVGEKLGHDGVVNKALMTCLTDLDELATAVAATNDDSADEDASEAAPESYSDLSNSVLKEELDKRGIGYDKKAAKATLVGLLETDDDDA